MAGTVPGPPNVELDKVDVIPVLAPWGSSEESVRIAGGRMAWPHLGHLQWT